MEQNSDVDWIPGFSLEYMFSRVYTKVQDAKTDWSKTLMKINPTKITRCMYVKGASKKDKDDWKENKGIVRKKNVKSQAQSNKESNLALEINKLKAEGKSVKDIALTLKVSRVTVNKYLKKH